MSSIKLVSVNIELDNHLDRVWDFLKQEKPDVVCLQEAHQQYIEDFANKLGMQSVFAPMSNIGKGERALYTMPPFFPYGVGMLSALPIQDIRMPYYRGTEEEARTKSFSGNSKDDAHPLLCVTVQREDKAFTIATTHFTWSPDGKPDDVQKKDIQNLLSIVDGIPELILCGDFNAPRGGEIFSALSQKYTDNIPAEYTTSIDTDLHRDGEKMRGKSLMVDGLFTTPQYECSNVRLVSGVSDHCAIVAEIQK
jgi:endonuclease/exonuclease/phosphatase family metal-dependent hydrolase